MDDSGVKRPGAALMRLVPERDDQDVCVSFTGIIVPYHTLTDGGQSPGQGA
jgi:hypothetical protein